jgi:thiosulfate dehydrogenase [quinone] large subunit
MRTLQFSHTPKDFANPQVANALLSDRAMAPIWLLVRLYVGWQWLLAGWDKLAGTSSIGWIHDGYVNGKLVHHGDRLLAFWQAAVAPSKSSVPQVGYPWYRDFLLTLIHHHAHSWFTYLIAGGEFTVGLCLVLGAFTAVAAAGGAVLNFNYMLAGSASLNPALFAAEVLLLLAWRSAGYVGLDRWLLPLLGTPWQPGRLFQRKQSTTAEAMPPGDSSRRAGDRPRPRAARVHRRRQLV